MAHDYESSKKTAYRIITILAIITIGEVAFALVGKGYIIEGWHVPIAIMGGVMIILSLVTVSYTHLTLPTICSV